jgi:hypothetical protein
MSETLEHLKRLEHEIECYKQIIKELSGYDVVGVGIDIKTPEVVARLSNGQTASNVYEAYGIGLKQATGKTTIYLTEGDIRYIYDKLGYKGILNKIDLEFARAIEKEVLRRNAHVGSAQ